MARQPLEVADIFRDHGPAWREANRGHLSHGQLKVMSAIERCRTAALGGHVSRCESCEHTEIAYNSCRNRHCPKCQGAAAKQWLAARESELLPVSYFHVVFTVPTQIGDIAYQNKAIVYNLLFKAAAETLLTIGADPKHLGALLGLIAVLHTWGSFKWKDYRAKQENRYKSMVLDTPEFIRRFLIHVLPSGFHRIRHYGFLANGHRSLNLDRARRLLGVKTTHDSNDNDDTDDSPPEWLVCPACGMTMRIIDVFDSAHIPHPPPHRGGDPP